MEVLVAYMSKTGNTKKVAEAIYGEIIAKKEIKPIDKVESIEGYDLVFLGFPIHAQGPDKKTTKLLKKLCINGKKIALFITHCAPEEAEELSSWLGKFRQDANRADIVDMFNCQGELSKTVKRFMSIYPNAQIRSWARKDNSKGQPDESRLQKARTFAKDVMEKVST